LDEPSQGLHHRELEQLKAALVRLKDRGNTIIIVDHDHSLMQQSDWIIDLGPGGGEHGGQIMAKFKPAQAEQFAKLSVTAEALVEAAKPVLRSAKETPKQFIEIKNPRLHNLKMKGAVKLPLERLTVVTGVSGAGKSSLIMGVLWRNLSAQLQQRQQKTKSAVPPWLFCDQISGFDSLEQVYVIDRKPLAKSSISMPATYLDVFTDLRDLYATMPEAQVAGLSARHFSLFHDGGRCEACKGRGYISISMKFLADARERCEVCQGTRYDARVNEIRFQGVNLAGVLQMSIEQARQHFQHHKKMVRKLQPAIDMGLGYLKMGQPSASLSGGEAQRLKLAPFLAKSLKAQSIVLLDEPTTGLHRVDVERLLTQLKSLVERGLTVVVMEHHEAVIQAADWVLELGPGAGHEGGELLFQGIPK
jgi:excinuclease ABC subunit A